jgi:hypothetical protein
VQFQHGIGDVVSAVAVAGLRVEFLHEHDHTLFRRFVTMSGDRTGYRLPEGALRGIARSSLGAFVEELHGWSVEEVLAVLGDLCDLAREAVRHKQHLYCQVML